MRCFYIEEIKYLKNNNYIICKTLEYIDELFIDFIYEEAFYTPFKFLDMMENIFNNKNINYVINTTSLISTYLIKIKDLEYFYIFLRKLLLKGFASKVIYKNEFIIIHYNNEFIKHNLCIFNSWTTLIIYKLLKENNIKNNFYLYSIFKNNQKEEVLDFLYIKDNNYQVISANLNLSLPSEIKTYNIIIYDTLNEIKNEVIKFTFNKTVLYDKILKILKNK